MKAQNLAAPAHRERAEPDIRPIARSAGVLYLVVIAGGLFSELAVRSALITPDDAAATTQAIAANATLWRLGLAVHLLYHAPAIVLYGLLYRLFRPSHASLARVALLFGVVSLTIEAVALLHLYVPLALLQTDAAFAAFDTSQIQALSHLATELFSTGWAFGLTHFGGFCLATGLLVLRSGMVPRAIGALLIAAGVCYPLNSLTYAFLRDVSNLLLPWILLPAFAGELSFALWLTIRGVSMAAFTPRGDCLSLGQGGRPSLFVPAVVLAAWPTFWAPAAMNPTLTVSRPPSRGRDSAADSTENR